MTKIQVLRDIAARKGVVANEVLRRAYLYVARNQSLPTQIRYQAQLQLNTFGRYTRPTTVKNRCTATGRGRGIISEFGLCRVSLLSDLFRRGGHFINPLQVPISVKSFERRIARCQEGLMVITCSLPAHILHWMHRSNHHWCYRYAT